MPSPRPRDGASIKYSQQYRRCGKAGCTRCTPPGRGHGPYWYAYWWEQGKARSRYLGKELPPSTPILQLVPAPAVVPRLRVRTLGGFVVWRSGEEVPARSWGRRQAAALFKALLGAPGYRVHREQLLELLVPEAAPAEAAKWLRATLYLLRRILDAPGAAASHVQTQGELVVLVPALEGEGAADWLDAEAFARTATAALAGRDAALCRAALHLYGGEYLPDDRYADWAERRREELRGLHLALLLSLADLSAAAGAGEEAVRCLRSVLAVDRCHEDAGRALLALLAEEGRRSEALAVYRELAAALAEEVGQPPAPETRAVHARLLATAPVVLLPPARRTNLPASLTSFVGREWERSEVGHLLQEERAGSRLVTLLGPGGCGKTRLAIEVARGLMEEYPDGVWLVELAGLPPSGAPESVLATQAVASTLGLREAAGQPPLDGLIAHLRPRHLLLVLDNCEHLAAAAAALAVALLEAAPGLRILATSQAPLGTPGEVAWRVPSLSLPERDDLPAADLGAYEAVQLLVERARAAAPRFALSDRTAGAVARICRRLDGIPLALELAAARLASLSAEGLAARLDDRFALLTTGNRTAWPRQQTLRATIEWSVSLLTGAERLLLWRLAVFAGGWTLAAAEAICAGPGLPQRAVLARLDGLVAKSLVQVEEAGEELRYRLLESVRAFAQELGEAAGELDAVRERHLRWYLALAEEAAPHLRSAQERQWLLRLVAEHDNLRAALGRARERGESEQGLRLVAALWRFWAMRGSLSEGRTWLETALAGAGPAGALPRANALNAGGQLAYRQGDYERAVALHEESLSLFRELGDTKGIAVALGHLGRVAHLRGDYVAARALNEESLVLGREVGDMQVIAVSLQRHGNVALEQGEYAEATSLLDESLVLFRELSDTYGIAASLGMLGVVAEMQGEYTMARARYEASVGLQRELGDQYGIAASLTDLGFVAARQDEHALAMTLLEESLELFREMGDRHRIAIALSGLGIVADLQGEHGRAVALHEESLSLSRELGNWHGVAGSLSNLGLVAVRQGHYAQATTRLKESLVLCRDLGIRGELPQLLECLAWVAAMSGQSRRAAQLLGATEELTQRLGVPLRADLRAGHAAAVQAVGTALVGQIHAAAWAEGRRLSLEEAVALALEAGSAS